MLQAGAGVEGEVETWCQCGGGCYRCPVAVVPASPHQSRYIAHQDNLINISVGNMDWHFKSWFSFYFCPDTFSYITWQNVPRSKVGHHNDAWKHFVSTWPFSIVNDTKLIWGVRPFIHYQPFIFKSIVFQFSCSVFAVNRCPSEKRWKVSLFFSLLDQLLQKWNINFQTSNTLQINLEQDLERYLEIHSSSESLQKVEKYMNVRENVWRHLSTNF